jgi:hypothetical protein
MCLNLRNEGKGDADQLVVNNQDERKVVVRRRELEGEETNYV